MREPGPGQAAALAAGWTSSFASDLEALLHDEDTADVTVALAPLPLPLPLPLPS